MSIVGFLHSFKPLRKIAKAVSQNIDIKQKFYGGYIYLNAVEHSWAWTGKRNYMNFDVEIQQFIHESSKRYDTFIDIGCNVGAMAVGTMLNNKNINTVAIDPNKQAIALLEKSLKANRISHRCTVINAVVSDIESYIGFDGTGSVTGHVTNDGDLIKSIKFSQLLNQYNGGKVMVKIDTEGYETIILKDLINIENLNSFFFIIEIHPLDFNGIGNPEAVMSLLKENGLKMYELNGKPISTLNQDEIRQIYAIKE